MGVEVLFVLFAVLLPQTFPTGTNLRAILTNQSIPALLALGATIPIVTGRFDLSIGYVSGIAGVVVAKLQFPDGSWETTGLVAIVVAVIVTALIGLFQGSFVAIIGVPSFVVTLAGLLFWQGVILYSIGEQGVIVIDDSLVNNVSNYFFSDTAGYVIAAIAIAAAAATDVNVVTTGGTPG